MVDCTLRQMRLMGFRSIYWQDVDFDNPTFVVGPNGSGKSNFTDAFAFLSEAMAFPLQAVIERRGGFSAVSHRGSARGRPSNLTLRWCWRSRIAIRPRPATTSICARGEATTSRSRRKSVSCNGPMGRLRSGAGPLRELRSVGHQRRIPGSRCRAERPGSAAGRWGQALSAGASFPVGHADVPDRAGGAAGDAGSGRRHGVAPGRQQCCQRAAGNPAQITGGGPNANLQLLESVVPGTVDVRPKKHGNQLTLEFTQARVGTKPVKFEAFSMSDGTLRVLGLITAVFQRPAPSLLVIEEPEASMHPGALGSILDVLRLASRSMQVVVTTHSPDILDAKWIEDRHLRILSWQNGSTRIGRASQAVRSALGKHLMGAGELLRSNALTSDEETDSDSP